LEHTPGCAEPRNVESGIICQPIIDLHVVETPREVDQVRDSFHNVSDISIDQCCARKLNARNNNVSESPLPTVNHVLSDG
jgi:hypothetical protein